MKKSIIIFFGICLSLSTTAQVQIVVFDKNNTESSATTYEFAVLNVTIENLTLNLSMDFDGSGNEFLPVKKQYILLNEPLSLWDDVTKKHRLLFDLVVEQNKPIACSIEIETKNIMLFYNDKSALSYCGKGVQL